jgi:hypothetical protein
MAFQYIKGAAQTTAVNEMKRESADFEMDQK